MPPTTYPTIDVDNLELTPMEVSFKGPSDIDYVKLGATLDNVVIANKYSKSEMKADQFGDTVLNRKVSGCNIMVTTSLAELLNKDLLKVMFPHGTLVSTGTKLFKFVTNVGDSDRDNAGALRLHPLSKSSTDVSEDWNFPVACASAESEFTYGPTEQLKGKIVWNIYPDLDQTPAVFAYVGDTSLS